MKIEPEDRLKKTRISRYIPNLAAAHFRPTEDWKVEEAQERYRAARFPFDVDRIHYGDCIEEMKRLPAESLDCVVADPPFGLSFTGKESIYNRDDRYVRGGYREIQDSYEEFSSQWIKELLRLMKDSASAWIFSGWTNLGDILSAIKQSGLNLVNHIIWKYQFGVFTQRKFVTSHYHILFLTKTEKYYFNKVKHYPLDVWEINRTYRKAEVKNGTKLPKELVERCIDFTSRPGDLVFDPFMGNGTTAVVSKGTFRHYLGFEINKTIREVIESNLASVKVGQFYKPYAEREDELVTRARRRYGLNESSNGIVYDTQSRIELWAR